MRRHRIWTALIIAMLAILLLRGCKEEEVGLNTDAGSNGAVSGHSISRTS